MPVLSLRIGYTYHPVPPFGPSPQADIPTPDKEAILLSPLRAPKRKMSPLDTGVVCGIVWRDCEVELWGLDIRIVLRVGLG